MVITVCPILQENKENTNEDYHKNQTQETHQYNRNKIMRESQTRTTFLDCYKIVGYEYNN